MKEGQIRPSKIFLELASDKQIDSCQAWLVENGWNSHLWDVFRKL